MWMSARLCAAVFLLLFTFKVLHAHHKSNIKAYSQRSCKTCQKSMCTIALPDIYNFKQAPVWCKETQTHLREDSKVPLLDISGSHWHLAWTQHKQLIYGSRARGILSDVQAPAVGMGQSAWEGIHESPALEGPSVNKLSHTNTCP